MKSQLLRISALGLAIFLATLPMGCSKKTDLPSPVADFTFTGPSLAPATVSFSNTSTYGLTYLWDFGDNQTSTEKNPVHTFTAAGNYSVKLTATNAGGSAMVSKTVNVQSPTSVRITSVKILSMPFTDENGNTWDSNSGADLYFTLRDAGNNVLVTGATFPDVTGNAPVLAWAINPSYQVTDFNATYRIVLYDKDSPDADDFIGGYNFPFSLMASVNYPGTFVLQLPNNALKIEIGMTWQ